MPAGRGWDEGLGAVAFETESAALPGQPDGGFWAKRRYSEATAREIDLAVRSVVTAALDRATAILTDNREQLAAGAALLLEHETLGADQLPKPRAAAPRRAA